ncbi:hypothetical protein BC826DRAFT_1028472 [Russula brevipes]|nr:hypothetical protein BC826DRAFT_1028472 [Russula brevipes]
MLLFQDRVPQFNAPTFHQPLACASNIRQQTVQDSSDVHFPFQSAMPASPQNLARQPNAPMSLLLLVCPKSNCRVQFHPRQERDRHFRSHFAYSLPCPFPRCPWRGSRQSVYKVHWKRNHQKRDQAPVRRQNVISKPDPLMKLVHWDALTVESASEISLSIVRITAEKINKLGVWEGGWGRRAKFSQ